MVFNYVPKMGNDVCVLNSSDATRGRAKLLADEIGSWHLDVSIDTVVSAFLSLFQTLTGKRPRYKVKKKGYVSFWFHNFSLSHMANKGACILPSLDCQPPLHVGFTGFDCLGLNVP